MNVKNKKKPSSVSKFQVGDALWRNIFKNDKSRQETVIAILRQVPLFHGTSKANLKEFVKIIHRRKFKENETIFWESEPGVGMYIVEDGSVAIFKNVNEQEKEELAKLKRGEFFGELALLDESPRSATAIALEETKILGLFRPDLMGLIDRKPRLGNKFLFQLARTIGERLKHTNEELQALWAKVENSKMIT
ncbi:MAG: cyclic nucleotide-binding domain-containing protein [bacterium]